MHFVALNEVLILLETCGRVRNVRPDVLIQVPAEVLIRHGEEQSKRLDRSAARRLQGSCGTGQDILLHCTSKRLANIYTVYLFENTAVKKHLTHSTKNRG